MNCAEIQDRLGELLDDELDTAARTAVSGHVRGCATCAAELRALQAAAAQVEAAGEGDTQIPYELSAAIWGRIEAALDAAGPARPAAPTPSDDCAILTIGPDCKPRGNPWVWRSLASAAVVLLAVGLGWFAFSGPGTPHAVAGQIDFRPLLEKAGEDIGAGIRALVAAHGGEPITREQAARRMRVRVHPPDELPGGLRLVSMNLLNMGAHHRSLAFHFEGPSGQLLLLQCPAGIEKEFGNRECIACNSGAHDDHVVRVGPLRLMHFDSSNVCVCVVSTLDGTTDLPAALAAVRIDF